MSVQPLSASNAPVNSSPSSAPVAFEMKNYHRASSQNDGVSAAQSMEYASAHYSSDSLLIQYVNNDGDSVSISSQSVDYQKTIAAANKSSSPDDWKKIIDSIKDEYQKMKGSLVATLVGNHQAQQADGADDSAVSDPRAFDEADAIPGLPDYWSADKTAQRIVDFATSFLSAFKGSGDEFLSTMKDAIEKGFSQAKDISGDLPSPIGKLVEKTHALVNDKIDAWAKQQGIGAVVSSDQQGAAASS